jgi:hypothetical protein
MLLAVLTVRFVRQLFADLRQIVLTSGVVEVGYEFGALAHERTPAPEQVPRGAHLGGVDIRLGNIPPRSKTAILWASILSFLALPP